MTDNKNKTPECGMHEALISYLYQESTPEETRQIESHLIECHSCKDDVAGFGSVRQMLSQWQLNDVPIVRVDTGQSRRRFGSVLRELLTLSPVWVRCLGGLAAAMLILAVLGTDINVGSNGVSLKLNLLRKAAVQPTTVAEIVKPVVPTDTLTRDEAKALVSQLVLDNEKQHRDEMKAELASLEVALKSSHTADVARISARVQEQRERITSLEHDIDRRESLDLTDILSSRNMRNHDRLALQDKEGAGGQ